MVLTKPFKELLHNQYQSVGLQQVELGAITKLQKTHLLKRVKYRVVFVSACCLFVVGSAVSWHQMAAPSTHELAMFALEEHRSLTMAEVQTNRFKEMESYFYRLNVQVNPISRSDKYWEWVGARRCNFLNVFGAHFYLRNIDTGVVESVFQIPYVAPFTNLSLRENYPIIKEYGSKVVRMRYYVLSSRFSVIPPITSINQPVLKLGA